MSIILLLPLDGKIIVIPHLKNMIANWAYKCVTDSKSTDQKIIFPIKCKLGKITNLHPLNQRTFIVSPIEKGFENCIDKPLNTLPSTSLAAKAVATPVQR